MGFCLYEGSYRQNPIGQTPLFAGGHQTDRLGDWVRVVWKMLDLFVCRFILSVWNVDINEYARLLISGRLKMQDQKMEDQRSERVFCKGNMRDCVVEKTQL